MQLCWRKNLPDEVYLFIFHFSRVGLLLAGEPYCGFNRLARGLGLGRSFSLVQLYQSSSAGYSVHPGKLERPGGKMRYLPHDKSPSYV